MRRQETERRVERKQRPSPLVSALCLITLIHPTRSIVVVSSKFRIFVAAMRFVLLLSAYLLISYLGVFHLDLCGGLDELLETLLHDAAALERLPDLVRRLVNYIPADKIVSEMS